LFSPFFAGAQATSQTEARGAWQALYTQRLESSASYREAALTLKSAQLALDQLTKPYVPVLSLSTGSGGALSYGSQGFGGGSLVSSLGLENLLGGELALRSSLAVSPSGDLTLGDPSLSFSRKLFTESDAQRLDAEAALLNAQASLNNAEITVQINLAKEILDARYYSSLNQINQRNLEVLERVKAATIDSTAQRELERRILQAQKSLLAAKSALAGVSAEILTQAEPLYDEIVTLQASWLANLNGKEPSSSLSTLALEQNLAAAQKRKEYSFLPFVPNPSVSASISYDIDKKSLGWGFSLSFSYDVFNKGKNSLDALKREEYPEIYSIKLADARATFFEGLKSIENALQSLELDRKIQGLDVEEAREAAAKAEALFNGGFSSEETLVMAQIDLSVELLAADKIEYDIIAQSLGLIQYFGAESLADIGM
jgi:outer membrane protein TolC